MLIDLDQVPRSIYLAALENNLRELGSPSKVFSQFLAAARDYLDGEAAWILRAAPARGLPQGRAADGDGGLCEWDLSRAFLEHRSPELPRDVLLSPLKVHGRDWAVIGLARSTRQFKAGSAHALNRLAHLLSRDLARREDERLTQVLDRIKEKIVGELRHRDLAYQILDGLHELVDYDHSAALLILDAKSSAFRIEAEKIVWTKGQSAFIGHSLPADEDLVARLREPDGAYVLSRGPEAESGFERQLLELATYNRGEGIPAPSSLLLHTLFVGTELIGLLRIANRERHPFDDRDVEVVERFVPAAAVALRNMRVRVSLENQALQAELRAGLATLSRAVAHDVNNALGSILPLARQALDDLREGRVDPPTLESDLEVIADKAALCKRIFFRMLRLSTDKLGSGPIDVNQCVGEMLPVLEAQARARAAVVRPSLTPGLPAIVFSRQHLEHVLWNLVNNSLEALAGKPGTIEIVTERKVDEVVLTIRDNGPGISPRVLERIEEPFFTTKPEGTGLGLSICRSLVWQFDGTLQVLSEPGAGTEVRVRLPVDLELRRDAEDA